MEHHPKTLVALEPRSYRSAIGLAMQAARPGLDVEIVDPDDLCSEVTRLNALLVLCSKLGPDIPRDQPAWIEYRPYDEPNMLRVNGKLLDLGRSVELTDLLTVIDDVVADSGGPLKAEGG